MTVFTQRMAMLAVLFAAGVSKLFAQGVNFVEPRLIVNAPASISGSKPFNWSQNPTNTTPWGRKIDTSYFQVDVVKAYDTLGEMPLLNGTGSYPSMANKFALIMRGGGVSFSQKAKYCKDKGAIGVIIVNHKNGGTLGMAPTAPFDAGVDIPVLIVSRDDGYPMNEALKAGQNVKISLTAWGYKFKNDLGIVDASPAVPHSFCIPLSQVNGTSVPRQYNFYNGSFLGNFGTDAQTDIKVSTTLTFTPTGGAATQIWTDTVKDASFPRADSIHEYFSNNVHRHTFTTTGVLNMNTTASAALADENPTDNSVNYSMYVTDSVFCKSRWNAQLGMPVVSSSLRFAAAQPLVWGPLFYVTKGGYRAHRAQLAITSDSDRLTDPLVPSSVLVYLYKWTDVNTDGLVNGDELSIEAIGFKNSSSSPGANAFNAADSSGKPFFVDLSRPNSARLIPRVQDNSWYFLAAELENNFSLGADNYSNFFTRNHLSRHADSSATSRPEYWAPNTSGNIFAPYVIAADTLSNISFFNKSIQRVEQIAYKDLTGLVPAMALHISKSIPTSIESNQVSPFSKLEIFPNPASDQLSVNVALGTQSSVAVSVVNTLGQSVYFKVHHGFKAGIEKINTANMPAGNYYLVVATDKGSEVRAFTIVHN